MQGSARGDALEQLGSFIDRAALREAWLVRVIHGHGTGALKRAIRQQLPRLGYALRFRPGERDEGGDGVTIVQFGKAPVHVAATQPD
jgi:DNA mismatch repair protein MutS2